MAFRKVARIELLAAFKSPESGWRKTARSSSISHFAQANHRSIQAILDSVSDKYAISKDPEDYIFTSYRAVTENVPNGNGDAFPREELLSWNKAEKKPVYQTFEFKPNHVNHQSDNPIMARGVVVDTHYNESNPDDRFVELLIAIDAKKDPILAKGVEDGILDDVSMGCDALRTVCNVCSNEALSPADYCAHVKSHKMKMCAADDGTMKQAFEWCYDVTFQEISIVDDPADKTAQQTEVLTVQEIPSGKMASADVLELKAHVKTVTSLNSEANFKQVASRGANMEQVPASVSVVHVAPEKVAAKKKKAEPEHHTLSACYAKHHEACFGDSHKAMEETMHETGKSEDEVREAWSKKMAEDLPHADAPAICASLNAQLKACGDIKKAVKRAAKDLDLDPVVVDKCAAYMRECNRMANYSLSKAAQEEKGKDMNKESAESPPIATSLPAGDKSPELGTGEKQPIADKIAEAAKVAAQKVANPKKAQEGWRKSTLGAEGLLAPDDVDFNEACEVIEGGEGDIVVAKDQTGSYGYTMYGSDADVLHAEMGFSSMEAAKAKVESLMSGHEGNKKGQFGEPGTSGASPKEQTQLENTRKDPDQKTAQAMPPAAPVAEKKDDGAVDAAQQADAPDKKSLGDMGVKTADDMPAEVKEKIEEKKAAVFPYAKFYGDLSAKKTASGEVHVTRGGQIIFTIPKERKASAQDAIKLVASVGLIGAMKKLGAISKKADAGVQEGATPDAKGAYGPAPQSSQEGAITDARDVRAVNPHSTTADGAITDEKQKYEQKSIENSDVREQVVTDNKGGRTPSLNEVIQTEHPNAKEKHQEKNVGTDNVLSGRNTDFILKGLDPRSAALVRENLAKIAQNEAKDKEKADAEAKKAQAKADEEKEKEVEKKASAMAATQIDRFKRGVRLAARRFALNLEPCDLKWSMGEVLSSRHEASGFEGLEADLVIDTVERGFSPVAMMKTVDHMIKRGTELSAMPEDSLKAIEKDADNLAPVHPQASSEKDDKEMKQANLRRRAAMGSLPSVRSSTVEVSSLDKASMVRLAIGSGVMGRKFGGR